MVKKGSAHINSPQNKNNFRKGESPADDTYTQDLTALALKQTIIW